MDTEQVIPLKKISKEALTRYFKEVYKLGDEQIVIMLESSATSLNNSLSSLYKVIEDGDNEETVRLAHSIKGLLLNMGQAEWSNVARELEQNAEKLGSEKSLELVKALHQGVEELL